MRKPFIKFGSISQWKELGATLFNDYFFITVRLWPQVVRERVRSTYAYFAGSLGMTALTAYAVSQSRFIFTMMRASPLLVKSLFYVLQN